MMMGPSFKPPPQDSSFLEEVSNLYPNGSIQPLVVDYLKLKKFGSWNKDVNPARSWYTIDAGKRWPAWVGRLYAYLEKHWKVTRLYGLIMLSKQSITFDNGLMTSYYSFRTSLTISSAFFVARWVSQWMMLSASPT
ncbi:hypothetical protein CFOL_v3_12909 [Cephalotus follicularis]|uniref:Uncharacterized protein n=1 Tax=Cephalotus follicularis TaxID=3775 RepID=A0A1Q3BNC8_CEPFO|nr:hypothetical protein CFOL_v3_12909 [Cephalotus follicularis]